MDKKKEILRRLSASDNYVSGQELCAELQVSRTAVWKIIKKLKEEGYPIEAVTNKGYRLLSVAEADVYNHETISRNLTTEWAGRPLIFKEETGSTNDDIFALAAEGYPHGTLAVASRQTAGKGRRGRNWISPQDGNIYMSILLKPDIRPENAPILTVVMALSVYQAIEALPVQQYLQAGSPDTGLTMSTMPEEARINEPAKSSFGIKWPNDIVASVNGGPYRKLCGILTEMRMEDNEISAITIGSGLNVNQTAFEPEIAENATSLFLTLGKQINRAALTAAVWKFFEQNYQIFAQTGDFSGLRGSYEKGLVNMGRAVHVLDPQRPFTGTAAGINDRGELLVKPDDGGPVRMIGTGEVSVRGVAGYV